MKPKTFPGANKEWTKQNLSDLEVVYMWADGLYVKAGIADHKAALLIIIAAPQMERKYCWHVRAVSRKAMKAGYEISFHGDCDCRN